MPTRRHPLIVETGIPPSIALNPLVVSHLSSTFVGMPWLRPTRLSRRRRDSAHLHVSRASGGRVGD